MAHAVLSEEMLDIVAQRFRILGEPQRLRILQALQSGEKTVNRIVEEVDGNQSNISRHLQTLFEAGLAARRRKGNCVYYSIADPVVFRLCDLVCRSAADKAQREAAAFSGERRRGA